MLHDEEEPEIIRMRLETEKSAEAEMYILSNWKLVIN